MNNITDDKVKNSSNSDLPNLLKANSECSFYSSCQIEEFDKKFEDFRKNIKSQMEQFGKENNCRVIILDHDLLAIVNIRRSNIDVV